MMSNVTDGCPVSITPYDQSGLVKPPSISNLNYTNQDFWSMKQRLVQFINQRFGTNGTDLPNTFNDMVEGDIAIMLMENWAFLADTLSFKIDQVVNELFIDTVTEIENAFRLSNLVGFKPQPPIAARALYVGTINSPITADLFIATPIVINLSSNGAPLTVELFAADSNNNPLFDQDIIIPAGSTSNQSVVGLEGRTFTETVSGLGVSGQTIQLSQSPVVFDSVRVQVDGIPWNEVDAFTDSQPRREFRVAFDSDYNGFIIFGNNRAGMIPSQGSSIQVIYRVGGGPIGNIVTGFASTQIQQSVDGFNYSVPVTFTNYTKGEFGYAGDTIEDIRRKLPQWIKTQNRCVSGDDYKQYTEQFATPYHGQIGKSTAVLRNYGCAANVIDLYILAADGAGGLQTATNELKVDLNDQLNNVKMLTDYVCIRDGSIIITDVVIDVTIDKFYRKFEQEYRTNILNMVNVFFSLNNWDYGQILKDTDIIKIVGGNIKELEEVTASFVTSDSNNSGSIITTNFYEIIRPGTITVTFLYT